MVVGYGAMGSNHARVLATLPREFSLKAIADPNDSRLQAARLQHPSVLVVDDYRSCIASVDSVVIASPTHTHLAITRDLLLGGKHCLLEKPCTCDSASTQELIDLAKQQGTILQVGHVERFNPAVLALFGLLKHEQVISITAQRWGMATRESDVDVVLDLMIHDLELVAAMLGQDPVEVRAQRMGCKERLDAVSAMVKYSGGVHATFSASRITPTRHRVLHVTTSHTHYELDFTRRTLRAYSSIPPSDTANLGGNESRLMEFSSGADPLTRQALAFAASVRERATSVLSHASVLAAMELAGEIKLQLGLLQ
ncbi:MAG: Gfo/Idh/MocA family oxidoreductase [Bacillota bacterium]|nr:Gfo/Idh/MocA family oxidoreductase [Bacillota bacterium]